MPSFATIDRDLTSLDRDLSSLTQQELESYQLVRSDIYCRKTSYIINIIENEGMYKIYYN